MTKDQLTKTIYFSTFSVIRMLNPPVINVFLKIKNSELFELCKESSPSDWPSFWTEVLADQIEKDLRIKYKVIIVGFDSKWFDKKDSTIQDLIDYILKPGNLLNI